MKFFPLFVFVCCLLLALFGATYCFSQGTWTQKAKFSGTGRTGAVGFSIGSKGYIGTGSDSLSNRKDFWEYDTITNAWTQKANFGGTARYGAVGFSIGNKGFIGTGMDGIYRKDFWQWDQITNTWSRKADFGGTVREGAVGFSIGGKGYIGTGADSVYFHYDFWEFDTTANNWTQKAYYPGIGGGYGVGFSIGNKGFIGTGIDGLVDYAKDFWEYDPITNTWTQKADLNGPSPLYRGKCYAVGFSIGDKGYIGLGADTLNSQFQDFWEYDTTANTWTQKTNFGGLVRIRAVGFSIGAKGYIGTGYNIADCKDFWEFAPLATDIKEIQDNIMVSVFPNPLTSSFTISINEEIQNGVLKIFNVQGNIVKNIPAQGKVFKIQNADLETGIYFYSLISQEKIITQGKIIVSK